MATIQQIVEQATDDAILHQDEFPGEQIKGDWDSEAFSFCDADPSDWTLYREVLHAVVNAMVSRTTAKESQ